MGVGTFLDFIIMDQTDVVPSFNGVKAWYHQFVGFSEFQESVESKKHVPEMKSKNAFLTMSSPRNVHMYMFSSSFLRLLNDRNDY